MSTTTYAHPEVLVDTQWVEDHLKDSNVRIAEVDYDPKANYQLGHVPSSVLFDWKQDINDPISRNVLSKQACEDLLQRAGINNDTTLVLYGDFNNWFAAFAFWVFKYYGFKDVRIMNGGRKKWLEEEKRSLDSKGRIKMVDVRSPKEFTGEILAPPEYPTEHAQRGGHIPGAENIPWAQAVN